jgi:hypothetical protein
MEQLTPTCSSLHHEASGCVGLENGRQCCIIDTLKVRSFNSLSFTDRRVVILNGKPTPSLSELKTKVKVYTRHFQTSYYKSVKWLTSCSPTGKLYCWPCLLFVAEKGIWSHAGFNDIINFHKASGQHVKSQSPPHSHSIKNIWFC